MTRKKRGFWTFCFSLIPGAGEMYLGFMKRGVSMMCLFLGWFAFCGFTGFNIGMCLLPVMWFYSFFQVHNLVSLPDEEFYQQEDDYLFLHMDKIVGVDKWEDLPGKYIRFEDNGCGFTVTKIGNIIKDKWFDLKEFFGKVS